MESSARTGSLVVSCLCNRRRVLLLKLVLHIFQVCSIYEIAVCNVLVA